MKIRWVIRQITGWTGEVGSNGLPYWVFEPSRALLFDTRAEAEAIVARARRTLGWSTGAYEVRARRVP